MSRFRILVGWPGPRWLFPLMGALTGMGTFLATRNQLEADYPRWADVSAAWHESLWIPGALAGAAAALVASLYSPRDSPVFSQVRPRMGVVLSLAHGGALALWVLAGHAFGLLPIHLSAARGATYGRPALADVLIAVAGVFVLTMLGYAAGVVVAHWLVVPMVGLVLFGLMGLPYEPLLRPLGLLLPVRQFIASPRFEVNPFTALFTVVASVTIGLAAVVSAAWWRSRGSVRSEGLAAATWSTATAGIILVAFVWRPEFYVVDRPVPVACDRSTRATVCLHRANLPAMKEVVATVAALRSSGLSSVLSVTDAAVADTDAPRAGEVFVWLDPGPRSSSYFASTLREEVADQVSGAVTSERCAGVATTIESSDVLSALKQRVLQLAGFDALAAGINTSERAAVRGFARMGPARIAAFIARHREQITSCSLTSEMVRR